MFGKKIKIPCITHNWVYPYDGICWAHTHERECKKCGKKQTRYNRNVSHFSHLAWEDVTT